MSVIVPIVNLENSEDLMRLAPSATLKFYKEQVAGTGRILKVQLYVDEIIYQTEAVKYQGPAKGGSNVLGHTVMAHRQDDKETTYEFNARYKIAFKEAYDKAISELDEQGFIKGEIDGAIIIRGVITDAICRAKLNRIPDYDECMMCRELRCSMRQLWKMMEDHFPDHIANYKAGL